MMSKESSACHGQLYLKEDLPEGENFSMFSGEIFESTMNVWILHDCSHSICQTSTLLGPKLGLSDLEDLEDEGGSDE